MNDRWIALAKINTLSALAQIVQIGSITPLVSLTLQNRGENSFTVGVIVSASWIAVLLSSKFIPTLLSKFGLVRSALASSALTIIGILGFTIFTNLLILFSLNFIIGIGLIIRWVACDTWIVSTASNKERGRAIGLHETLMGAGIAAGPIIIALFGGANIYAFYICALITLFSGLISLTLRTVDLKPPIPQKNSGNSLIFIIPIAVFGGFAAGFCETSSIAFLVGYAVNEGYAMASAALLLTVFGIGGTKCSFL